jgi:hypothetical protein
VSVFPRDFSTTFLCAFLVSSFLLWCPAHRSAPPPPSPDFIVIALLRGKYNQKRSSLVNLNFPLTSFFFGPDIFVITIFSNACTLFVFVRQSKRLRFYISENLTNNKYIVLHSHTVFTVFGKIHTILKIVTVESLTRSVCIENKFGELYL